MKEPSSTGCATGESAGRRWAFRSRVATHRCPAKAPGPTSTPARKWSFSYQRWYSRIVSRSGSIMVMRAWPNSMPVMAPSSPGPSPGDGSGHDGGRHRRGRVLAREVLGTDAELLTDLGQRALGVGPVIHQQRVDGARRAPSERVGELGGAVGGGRERAHVAGPQGDADG